MSNPITHPPFGGIRSHTGSEVCLEAYDLITGARHDDYDHPFDDYTKVAAIYAALTGVELTVEQAVCFPLAMKLARIRTARENNRWHHDSVVDAIGYLGCLAMIHKVSQG